MALEWEWARALASDLAVALVDLEWDSVWACRTRNGFGMGPGMGFGMGPGMGFGMGPGMGFGMGPGMGFGMGPGMGFGMQSLEWAEA